MGEHSELIHVLTINTKTMKNYKFYILEENGNERFFCSVDCKVPKRTKAYKKLISMMNDNVIYAFKFTSNI